MADRCESLSAFFIETFIYYKVQYNIVEVKD